MVHYTETQRFRQLWLWLILLLPAGLMWALAYAQLVLRIPVGDDPAPNVLIVAIWLITGIALPALFAWANLRTEVRGDGIYVRFFPFHRAWRGWSWQQIETVEARTYRPLREYGGWGVRFGPSGTAYNTSGNQGVQIVLRSGRRILIGTQHPRRFMDAVHGARKAAV